MERGGHIYDVDGLTVTERTIDRPDGGQTRVVTFVGAATRDGVPVPLDPTDGTLHIVNPPELVPDGDGWRHDPPAALMHALLDHVDSVADQA